jgi:hypothetical protein
MRSTTTAVMSTVMATVALAGCGGGGGSGISRTSYVRKANAVCANQKTQLDELHAPTVDVQSNDLTKAQLTQVADFFDAGVSIQRATISKLRALGYPKGERSTLTSIYDRADKGAGEIADASKAARAGDLKRMRSSLEAGTNDLDAAQHEINAYGLDKCGSA